jgi:hypothetical protein
MSRRDADLKVLIAVTETSAVDVLWRAALRRLGTGTRSLTAVFVSEDHWRRAASLPFTREISRVGGANTDFTMRRASQVHAEAVARARALVGKLAAEASLDAAFEELHQSDVTRTRGLLEGDRVLLIAPALIRRRPIVAEIEKLGCRIEFVEDSDGAQTES